MLDIKLIRSNPEILRKALAKRKENFNIDGLLELDEKGAMRFSKLKT